MPVNNPCRTADAALNNGAPSAGWQSTTLIPAHTLFIERDEPAHRSCSKAAISVRRATCLNGELLKRHGRCRSPFLYQFATRLLAACGFMNRAAFTALNGGVIEPPRKKHS